MSLNTGWSKPVSIEKRCRNLADELRRLTDDVTQPTVPIPTDENGGDWYAYERLLCDLVQTAYIQTQNQTQNQKEN